MNKVNEWVNSWGMPNVYPKASMGTSTLQTDKDGETMNECSASRTTEYFFST